MARKLLIAVSVFFGVLTIVLCVLWLRSYHWRDRLSVPFAATRMSRIDSDHGKFEFETYGPGMGEDYFALTAISHAAISAAWKRDLPNWPEPKEGPQWRWEVSRAGRFFVHVPHWFTVLVSMATALLLALTSLPRSSSFSLRTLLIATTLVAAVLGLIMWAAS
jgi:hypothetical protein